MTCAILFDMCVCQIKLLQLDLAMIQSTLVFTTWWFWQPFLCLNTSHCGTPILPLNTLAVMVSWTDLVCTTELCDQPCMLSPCFTIGDFHILLQGVERQM